MGKYLIALTWALFALPGGAAKAQNLFFTDKGKVSFFSSAPLEDISAENKAVTSLLNTETGGLVFKVAVKQFQFPNKLMQEHFNENYLESEKFPQAQFKGKIVGADKISWTKTGAGYDVTVEGDMTIHGVTKSVKTRGHIDVLKDGYHATAKFKVRVADYDIDIPSLVVQNIAEEVEVSVDMTYAPHKP